MNTLPSLGWSSPPIMLKSVDFPEPEGPMMEMYSPRNISRLTPCRAETLTLPRLYSLLTLRQTTVYSARPSDLTPGFFSITIPPLKNYRSENLNVRPHGIRGNHAG